MESEFKSRFRRRLLRWYRQNRRDLPWRSSGDPYAVWVSEIMLQQTQVATVIPYYQKFLARFPTLEKLALAPETQVLALWSGLGYYRRAKLLHTGARLVLKDFGGRLPQQPEPLKKIPGIGAYTAGAIASIAFQKPVPVVDGNVVRVLARIFALRGHAKEAMLQNKIWKLAGELVKGPHPGDFNQALMELGATHCRPALPACEACPQISLCRAWRQGSPDKFPETPPAKKTLHLKRRVAVCLRKEKVLLVKPLKSRWFQGMWELPHDYFEGEAQASDLQKFLKRSLGIRLKNPRAVPATRHSITHHRIASHAWQGEIQGRIKSGKGYETTNLFTSKQVRDLPLSNFDRKVLKAGLFLP